MGAKAFQAERFTESSECALPLLGVDEPPFLVDLVALELEQDA
jgi:hypothetical protein